MITPRSPTNVGHFKAVHHIAALEYLLAAAFILLALYASERQYRSGAPRWLALFALAALLCSTLVYNSLGAVDEHAISNLVVGAKA